MIDTKVLHLDREVSTDTNQPIDETMVEGECLLQNSVNVILEDHLICRWEEVNKAKDTTSNAGTTNMMTTIMVTKTTTEDHQWIDEADLEEWDLHHQDTMIDLHTLYQEATESKNKDHQEVAADRKSVV